MARRIKLVDGCNIIYSLPCIFVDKQIQKDGDEEGWAVDVVFKGRRNQLQGTAVSQMKTDSLLMKIKNLLW